MEEDENDFYGTNASTSYVNNNSAGNSTAYEGYDNGRNHVNGEEADEEDQEVVVEEEEEDDDSDSDIDIITERPAGQAAEPTKISARSDLTKSATEVEASREAPKAQASVDTSTASPAKRKQRTNLTRAADQKPGYEYEEVHTSAVDVDVVPVYDPSGKPITEVDFDADLVEHDKPWRRPGSDQADYFNYGFDEFTWTLYCEKQKFTRQTAKAQNEQFQSMMGGGPAGMPSMPGMMGAAGGIIPPTPSQNQQMPGQPAMPQGMPEMSNDLMNKMMGMMINQGMDPSQMDFNSFTQMYQQMQGPGNAGNTGPMMGQNMLGQGFGMQGQFGGAGMEGAAGPGRHMNNNPGPRNRRNRW